MTLARMIRGIRRSLSRLAGDASGAAAVEFVLWLAMLVLPILTAVDIGIYAFKRMQLEASAQAGAQAAWHLCSTSSQLPATGNCGADLLTKITAAAQSTSLGADVSVATADVVEGYYCVDDDAHELQLVGSTGTIGAPPAVPTGDCSAYGGSLAKPADYIQVTATYAYSPVFSAVQASGLLPSPITRTAWVRLN